MKLVLLHGPAINNSRLRLSSIRQEFDTNNVVIFEEGTSVQEIFGGLMTQPLLVEDRLIILENPPEDLNLSQVNSSLLLVIWFDHEISEKKPIMEWAAKNGQVLFFPPEKESTIFPFLDLLGQKNPKAYLELNKLQKTHEKFSDNQYLVTMILYLLRTLTVIPKNAAPFIKQKLEKQRKNFTREKLTKLYKEFLEIDFKLKKGLLEKDQAEFLLVNKFIAKQELAH